MSDWYLLPCSNAPGLNHPPLFRSFDEVSVSVFKNHAHDRNTSEVFNSQTSFKKSQSKVINGVEGKQPVTEECLLHDVCFEKQAELNPDAWGCTPR